MSKTMIPVGTLDEGLSVQGDYLICYTWSDLTMPMWPVMTTLFRGLGGFSPRCEFVTFLSIRYRPMEINKNCASNQCSFIFLCAFLSVGCQHLHATYWKLDSWECIVMFYVKHFNAWESFSLELVLKYINILVTATDYWIQTWKHLELYLTWTWT